MGLHQIPDTLSRLPYAICNSKDYAIERFLYEILLKVEATFSFLDNTTLLSLCLDSPDQNLPLAAATSLDLAQQLVQRSTPITLGSLHTWIQIYKDCSD